MQTKNSDSGRLLTVEERSACVVLAEGDSLQSKRAQALLALDEGATQKEASEQTGLTLGQVQYWLKKFRNGRMTIFTDIEPTTSDDPTSPSPAEVDTAAKPKKVKRGESAVKSKKAKKKKKKKKKKKSAKKRSKKSTKNATK